MGTNSQLLIMLVNYFKIAWRNLLKDRQFTLLNLLGLSAGLACALFICLWVTDELQMDKYNANDDRLYQVMQNLHQENGIETTGNTAALLADALATEMPEVASATTVLPASWFSSRGILSLGNTRVKAGGQFVSRDFFRMFSCPVLQGSTDQLFTDKHTIAISDELAEKLFKNQHVVGKIVEWSLDEFNGAYVIGAVFKKNPVHASASFDMLLNIDLFVEQRPAMKEWGNSDPHTYVLLKAGTDLGQFNKKLAGFLKTKEKGTENTLFARRFSDQYLYNRYVDGVQAGGRIAYVKLLSILGIFILVIACINFMNLSTAKASRRIKEVGIQKVVGATRLRLVWQYLGESLMMSFLALLMALGLIVWLLPAFNDITGKSLIFGFTPSLLFAITGITAFTGIVAGSYPALYISGFRPAQVLKGTFRTSVAELWVRKGLVVFQFTLSVMAIAGVLIIYRQINYIQSKNLGYQRDNIIHFETPLESDSASMLAVAGFIQELQNIPGVMNASSYAHNLMGDHGDISGLKWPGKLSSQDGSFASLEVGNNFLQTVGIKMKAGSYFSNSSNAGNEIIFNESAIRKMGLKSPVGKTVSFWGRKKQIVGVAEDFHFESLYQPVKPCFFRIFPAMPNVIVKIRAGKEKQVIAQVQRLFEQFNKGLVFDYRFMDEEYRALYISESRVAALSRYFAGLVILISCLGLFGLAAFTAQKRQKEIGIRKVVGATVTQVVVMLSKDFLLLASLALLIAFPLVWLTMSRWLYNFAYRITIGADVFLIAGIAVMLLTLLSISFQSVKAALLNPVKSLRKE